MLHQKTKTVRRVLVLALPALAIVIGALTASASRTALAATSDTVNFQARLLTASGSVVPDGYYNVEFKIYRSATSSGSSQGTCSGDAVQCLWTETRTDGNKVRVANGYLTVNLGSVASFADSMPWDQQLWLTMNIGGTGSPSWDGEMNPRLKLTATPYSMASGRVVSNDGTGSAIVANGETGTICIQNSVACGFLQLQGTVPGSAQAGNFTIVGTGMATTLQATTMLATAFDTPVADILSIGSTNATAINLNQNTNLAAGKILTVAGGATVLNGDVIGDALQVSNATSTGNIAIFKDNNEAVLTIRDGGSVEIRTATNSVNAFSIQGTENIPVLTVNTVKNTVHLRTKDATSSSTYDAIWLQGPKNGVTTFIGDNDATSSYTASDFSGSLRFNGSGVAWGDFAYYPMGGANGVFRFSTSGSSVSTSPNAKVGMGDLYVNGRAGIGVNSPTATFEVLGSSAEDNAMLIRGATTATAPVVVIRGGSTPGTAADLLQLQDVSANVYFKVGSNGLVTAARGFEMTYNPGSQLNIQGSSSTFVNIDPQNGKFYIGNQANCGGRFCVGQIITSAGTQTNTVNYMKSNATITTTSNMVNQDISIEDDSGVTSGTRNNNRGVRIDFSASDNSYSNYYGVQVKLPANADTSLYRGSAFLLENGTGSGNETFSVSNYGAFYIKNVANTTNAFRVLNSSGLTLFNIDTTSNRITLRGGLSSDVWDSVFSVKNYNDAISMTVDNYGSIYLNAESTSSQAGIRFNNSSVAGCTNTWLCASIRKLAASNNLYFSATDGFRFWSGSNSAIAAMRIDANGRVGFGTGQGGTLSEAFNVIDGNGVISGGDLTISRNGSTGGNLTVDSNATNGLYVRNGNTQVMRMSTNGTSGFSRIDAATSGLVFAVWDQANFAGGEVVHLYMDTLGAMYVQAPQMYVNSSTMSVSSANVYYTGITQLSSSGRSLCIESTNVKRVYYGTGTNCNVSSARYKQNIQTMTEELGLDMLMGLRPVTYEYISGDGSRKVGLIAEELAQILPEAVEYDDDGAPYAINYEYMVANLIKGIQQQQLQIGALQQGMWNGGLVSNDAIFNGFVTFNSGVVFGGDVTFDGTSTFNGSVTFNENTTGSAMLPEGQTEIEILFTQPYETVPNISVSSSEFVKLKVKDKTTDGFKIAIEAAQAHTILIDWIALQKRDAPVATGSLDLLMRN